MKVHLVMYEMQERWEDASMPHSGQRTARALATTCETADKEAVKAFLGEHGFPEEPETWTRERAYALLRISDEWFPSAWDDHLGRNPPADREKAEQGGKIIVETIEGLLARWEAVQPICVRVSMIGFREEKMDDILEAWSFWEEDDGDDGDGYMIVLQTVLVSTERQNEEVLARAIASDIFQANGTGCEVTVEFFQGLRWDDSRAYVFRRPSFPAN